MKKEIEEIRNKPAILIKDIELFFKAGNEITVLRYHHDFGGYEIKNKYGATTYVYRGAFKLTPLTR